MPAGKLLLQTRSGKTTKSDAIQNVHIKKLERKVKQLEVEDETRIIFTQILNTGISTVGLLTSIDAILQGDTSQSRSGLMIKPLYLEADLIYESEITDQYNIMRCMIVQSKKGTLTLADFSPVSFGPTIPQLDAYTVLYNKQVVLDNNYAGNVAGVPILDYKHTHHHIKVKVPRNIYYPDAGSTSLKNQLYVFFVSDSNAVAHPDVEDFTCRLTFKD